MKSTDEIRAMLKLSDHLHGHWHGWSDELDLALAELPALLDALDEARQGSAGALRIIKCYATMLEAERKRANEAEAKLGCIAEILRRSASGLVLTMTQTADVLSALTRADGLEELSEFGQRG